MAWRQASTVISDFASAARLRSGRAAQPRQFCPTILQPPQVRARMEILRSVAWRSCAIGEPTMELHGSRAVILSRSRRRTRCRMPRSLGHRPGSSFAPAEALADPEGGRRVAAKPAATGGHRASTVSVVPAGRLNARQYCRPLRPQQTWNVWRGPRGRDGGHGRSSGASRMGTRAAAEIGLQPLRTQPRRRWTGPPLARTLRRYGGRPLSPSNLFHVNRL